MIDLDQGKSRDYDCHGQSDCKYDDRYFVLELQQGGDEDRDHDEGEGEPKNSPKPDGSFMSQVLLGENTVVLVVVIDKGEQTGQ